MHIYSNTDLYHQYVQEQAGEAIDNHCISKASHDKIVAVYASNLYTPNYFIRIALGLLTVVALVFAGLLLALLFQVSSSASVKVLLFIFSIINYGVLEVMVKGKRYYNAGVDNVLIVSSALLFITPFTIDTYANQWIIISLVTMVLGMWMTARFVDSFMAIATYVALLAFIFLVYIKLGAIAKATVPFVMMMVSAMAYVALKKLGKHEPLLFYRSCIKWVIGVTLVSFYAACNYLVVKELSNAMFDLHLSQKDTIPFGWLFWVLTLLVPVGYVVYGLIKRDLVFIRIGVVLAAITVLTIRYYYAVLPAEIVMLLAGCILTAVGYWLTKYLATPRHGFVFDKTSRVDKQLDIIKTVVLIETTARKDTPETHTTFGGGSFGGGGAGEKY